jgi:ectoine hydroxylase-related dioxygenase (phytanoyl-CoA dioxygenase family)
MDFFKMNQLPISKRIEVPRDQLSEEQVGFYLDNGYLIVENVLSREEIAELHEDLLKTARGGYPCETLKPLPADIGDEEALENLLCIHQPHHISPVALKYVKHKKVVGRVSQLAGAHVPFWDGSTKCFQSLFFVKPPGFPGQAWHQDEGYVPTRDGSMCGAWIAMDDATVANGCLHVIPGSHTTRFLWPQKPHENPEEYDLSPMSYGFDESGQVPAEVRAGGIVFFNGYILHRSPKNRSQTYRRACVNHYTNAWTLIPRGDRQEGEKGFADRRDVVLTSGVDPYYWRGYKEGVQDVWLRPAVLGEFIKKSADKYAEVPQGGGVKVESA